MRPHHRAGPWRDIVLLGRNGAGKSTLLRAIMGIVPTRDGSICLDGQELLSLAPHEIARAGIAYCPDDRGIYASLSVRENLMLPPVIAEGGLSVAELTALFPNLEARARSAGTQLSGGEQQMLAIARILRTGARLLLLDEPTEGLAPVIVDRIGDLLIELRKRGYPVARYKLILFVLSAGLSGLAGSMKALVFQLAALSDVHWHFSGDVVLMVLLGGMHTVFGPAIGAIIVAALQHYLDALGAWVTLITGLIFFMMCVMTFRSGVAG